MVEHLLLCCMLRINRALLLSAPAVAVVVVVLAVVLTVVAVLIDPSTLALSVKAA